MTIEEEEGHPMNYKLNTHHTFHRRLLYVSRETLLVL